MCPRHDCNFRVVPLHVGCQLGRFLPIIHCDDQHFRLCNSCRFQKFRPGRVAKIRRHTEFAQSIHRLVMIIKHDRLVAFAQKHPIDDLAEPTKPRDDDRTLFVYLICYLFFFTKSRMHQLVIGDEQQRGEQHGKGDDQLQVLPNRARYDIVLQRKTGHHKAKFSRLGQ